MDAFNTAVGAIVAWPGPLLIVVGIAVGMLVALLPGLGGATAMAIAIPITYSMEPEHALLFLMCIMGSGGFAGSITAILLNAPGESVNAATALDGYPMAQRGEGARAVAVSAVASASGAVIGLSLFIVTIPLIRSVVLSFGPPEYFAIAVAGLLLIGAVSGQSPLRGLLAGLVGMLLGMQGFNQVVGGNRFTFGSDDLIDGISMIVLLSALFPLAEMLQLSLRRRGVAHGDVKLSRGEIWRGVKDTVRHWRLVVASSTVGWLIGVVPGVGGAVSSWAAYSTGYYSARDKSQFGKGDVRGVVAPEASNDSKDGGSLIPTLMLGIPGSVSTAIVLSAFLIHGVTPGSRLFGSDMHITWVIVGGLVIANVAVSTVGLLIARPLVRITAVPSTVIVPVVMVLAIAGAFAPRRTTFDLLSVMVLALLGFAMLRFNWSRAAMIIGFILAPIAERSYHQALQMGRDSHAVFFDRPITVAVLGVVVFLIVGTFVVRPFLLGRASPHNGEPAEIGATSPQRALGRDLGEFAFVIVVLGYVTLLLTEAVQLGERSRLFPMVVLVPAMVLGGILLFALAFRIVRGRRAARTEVHASGTVPASSPGGEVDTGDGGDRSQSVAKPVVWLLLAWSAIYGLGFMVGSPLFVASYVLWADRHEPGGLTVRLVTRAVTIAALVALSLHLIFSVLLGLRMHDGILW